MDQTKIRSCINVANEVSKYEPSIESPDPECINCILDHILSIPEGELRDICIGLYRDGLMKLECRRTKKSYIITKAFFDSINPNHL